MGAQMGKTEAMFNVLGHRFDDGPYVPALYIGPTQKQVKSVSKDRIAKMLKSTPTLWAKLEKGQRDGVTEKYIAGVRLGFGWAGSATELSSHPAGLVMIDERDRMDSDVSGEGDPVMLAKARTKNYPDPKVGVFSTPTVENASPIWSLFEGGTMGKWAWPCPECNEFFIPTLALLWWPDKCKPQDAIYEARLTCPHCAAQIENKSKNDMNAAGRFEYHTINETGEHIPHGTEPPRNLTASFWVSGLASPWQSFGQVAEILLSAYRSGEPSQIQAAINTYGGELFKQKGDAPEWSEVSKLRQPYDQGSIPVGVQMITAGVDVQKNGLFFVIRGWGFNSESWLIDHGFIAGETEYDNVWILLGRLIENKYGGRIIDRMFVDSGYRPGDKHRRPENQIYMFCRRYHGRAYPTKGHDTQDRPLKSNKIDVAVSGKTVKGGVLLWHINTDYFKSWLFARIRWPDDQEGGFHLHNETDEDYCKQITAEALVVKASGRRIWIQNRKDNHYLDCEVNAASAASSLQVHTLKPLGETKVKRDALQKDKGFIKRGTGSFVRR